MIVFGEAVAVSFLVWGIIREFRFKSQIPCFPSLYSENEFPLGLHHQQKLLGNCQQQFSQNKLIATVVVKKVPVFKLYYGLTMPQPLPYFNPFFCDTVIVARPYRLQCSRWYSAVVMVTTCKKKPRKCGSSVAETLQQFVRLLRKKVWL